MILYYALGGGLGHLTRARRVLAALELDATIVTASPFASDPRVVGRMPVLRVPPRLGHDRELFRGWLDGALVSLAVEELIVDSFPGGILGELCGMTLPPARHVARRLKWPVYAARLTGPLPRYEIAYTVEAVSDEHARELAWCSDRVQRLTLPAAVEPGPPLLDEPHWIVVHSGPDEELLALIERAADAPRLVVVSPRPPSRLPAGAEWRDLYPVAPYLRHAERIVTAAGFNAVSEAAPFRARHETVPFPRPLDDQFARAGS